MSDLRGSGASVGSLSPAAHLGQGRGAAESWDLEDEGGRPPPSGSTTGLCASAFRGVFLRTLAGQAVVAAGWVRRQRLRRSRNREAQAAQPSAVGLSLEFLPWTSSIRPRPSGQDARARPTNRGLRCAPRALRPAPCNPSSTTTSHTAGPLGAPDMVHNSLGLCAPPPLPPRHPFLPPQARLKEQLSVLLASLPR